MFARGIKTFPVSQYVIRRTRVLAPNFSKAELKDLDDEVFTAITTSTLKKRIPASFKPPVPDGVWVKQGLMWREVPPKSSLVEEWWHADYAEVGIYGKAK